MPLKGIGIRISAQFLCLDGRVSGQSSERLLACHSYPCLRFKGIDLGLFPAGSMGRLRRLGFVLWAAGLYRTREFCVAARFFLMEDGPESADHWPAPSVCRHPTLLQVQITPRRVPLGPLNVVRRRGEEVRKEYGTEPVGEAYRLVHIHICTHTYTHSSHQLRSRGASESQSTAGPQRAEGCSGRAVMWVEGWK